MSFTCTSHGFSPRNISLWFKNGNELSASQTSVDQERRVSYSISSTTKVLWAPGIFLPGHLREWPPAEGPLSCEVTNLSKTIKVGASYWLKSTPAPKTPAFLHLLSAPCLELPGIYFHNIPAAWLPIELLHSSMDTMPKLYANSFFASMASSVHELLCSQPEENNPTPCSCLESPIDRSLSDCSPRGGKESDTTDD